MGHWLHVDPAEAGDAPLAGAVATGGVAEEFVMVVAPTMDRLTGA